MGHGINDIIIRDSTKIDCPVWLVFLPRSDTPLLGKKTSQTGSLFAGEPLNG